MKKILFLECFFLVKIAVAQIFTGGFVPYPNTIPVNQNNKSISLPFAGGFDVPQFSACDLDFDGKKDLVVFDREGGKFSCFLNKGITGQIAYEYAPQYALKFPKKLTEWVLMVDYNGDGKEDIFTAIPGGVKIYKNTSTIQNGISFELVNGDVQADFGSFLTRLYSGPADMPAILDVDDDGDVDILSMELGIDTAGDGIYMYKNMSMETYGVKDSVNNFIVHKRCWGRFRESYQNCNVSLQYQSGPCATGNRYIPEFTKSEFETLVSNKLNGGKHSGSTLLVFDSNGDGKKDILIGDIGCNNMYLLVNSESNSNPIFTQFFRYYPATDPILVESFPAAFFIDVNNDNKRDLIAVPNTTGNADNFENIKLYLNQGTDAAPDFVLTTNAFLEEEMIEVGEGSHPVFVDFDQNGLMDFIVSTTGYFQSNGTYKAGLTAYKNVGTINSPAFELVSRDMWTLSSFNISNMVPTFGDVDHDNDLDMITGANDGTFYYFENTAGANNPFQFNFKSNYLTGLDVGNLSTPFLNNNLSANTRQAMISGERFDNINYWQDTSSTVEPKFKLITDSLFKINMRAVSGFPSGRTTAVIQKLFSADRERLVVSNANGKVYIFNHIDQLLMSLGPVLIDSINLIQGQYTLSNGGFGMSMADIDGDNKPELIAGNPQGGLVLFKNQIMPDGIQPINQIRNRIVCYPNPSKNFIRLRSTENVKINDCTLLNQLGQIILQEQINASTIELNLNTIPNGIYTLKITTAEGIQFEKIIKQ
ncbi:MAG: hypothetical protein RI952_935 [Bacteroidota bacterium]|jgi:hypothetical protein